MTDNRQHSGKNKQAQHHIPKPPMFSRKVSKATVKLAEKASAIADERTRAFAKAQVARQQAHADSDVTFSPAAYPLLHFTDEDWQWFTQACADFEIPLDDKKRDIVEHLYSHLVGVNSWMNLTRLTSALDYLKFHVLDSLLGMQHVEQFTEPGDWVLDLGSGGGYPGLPTMTWLPDRKFMLVDSRKKKADFLSEAVKLTGCPCASAAAFRGREVAAFHPEMQNKCQVVTARAVGRGADLILDAVELVQRGGVFILMKGPSYMEQESEEFDKACREYGFDIEYEMPMALDNSDPDRYIIAARRL